MQSKICTLSKVRLTNFQYHLPLVLGKKKNEFSLICLHSLDSDINRLTILKFLVRVWEIKPQNAEN